jgi:hypothetical protein
MEEEFSLIGFIKAIPAMVKKVWPGFWLLIVIITAVLYFSSPEHLGVLSFSDWAVLHVLVVIGMIAITIWIYNTFPRPAANLLVIGIWFMASAFCVLSDLMLKRM